MPLPSFFQFVVCHCLLAFQLFFLTAFLLGHVAFSTQSPSLAFPSPSLLTHTHTHYILSLLSPLLSSPACCHCFSHRLTCLQVIISCHCCLFIIAILWLSVTPPVIWLAGQSSKASADTNTVTMPPSASWAGHQEGMATHNVTQWSRAGHRHSSLSTNYQGHTPPPPHHKSHIIIIITSITTETGIEAITAATPVTLSFSCPRPCLHCLSLASWLGWSLSI